MRHTIANKRNSVLRKLFILFFVVAANGLPAVASKKGNCPPLAALLALDGAPLQWAKGSEAPQAEAISTGPIRLGVMVSDKGEVCSSSVLRTEADKAAGEAAKQTISSWHFNPAMKSGHSVATVISIDLSSWRLPDGKYVFTQAVKQAESKAPE